MKKIFLLLSLLCTLTTIKAQCFVAQIDTQTIKYGAITQLTDSGYTQIVNFSIKLQGCPWTGFEQPIGTNVTPGLPVFVPNSTTVGQAPSYILNKIVVWIKQTYQ